MDEVINVLQQVVERLKALSSQTTQESNTASSAPAPMAWGAKVSPVFRERVRWIADQIGIQPDWLMACMAWESAETFSSGIKNAAGSGAVGLIQFMPATAKVWGTSTEELARISPEDQLNYVYKYFRPYAGRLHNLGDVYMAILWPRGIGQPDSYVLWDAGQSPITFRQNAGLDVNHDKEITRGECLVKINEKLQKGLQNAA